MRYRGAAVEFTKSAGESAVQVTQSDILALEPELLKKPLSHKPNASDSYSFIHSSLLPSDLVFFFSFSLEAYNKCCS